MCSATPMRLPPTMIRQAAMCETRILILPGKINYRLNNYPYIDTKIALEVNKYRTFLFYQDVFFHSLEADLLTSVLHTSTNLCN